MILSPIGRFGTGFQAAFGYGAFNFSAAGEYVIQVFTAEDTMTITQFGMCVSSSSGSPPVRIAMWQYVKGSDIVSPLTKVYTDANPISTTSGITTPTFTWWNLTTPQTITRGTTYAIGLETYGTWSGGLSVVERQDQGKRDYSTLTGQPYSRTSASGSKGYSYRWGIASATKTFGYPVGNISVDNVGSFSVNGFAGVSFIVPTTMGATCKLNGVIGPFASNPNFCTSSLRLYNATSYPPTLITNQVISDGGAPSWLNAYNDDTGGQIYFPFTTPQTLTTGVKYLVGIQNSGDAFNCPKLLFNRAQDSDSLSDIQMYGVDGNLTTNTWTESSTSRWVMNLDVSDFTQGVGASGGGPVIGGRLIN
jgi:hypothetical protein